MFTRVVSFKSTTEHISIPITHPLLSSRLDHSRFSSCCGTYILKQFFPASYKTSSRKTQIRKQNLLLPLRPVS